MAAGTKIRKFTAGDALPLSTLICRTLLEENSRHYSLGEIERLVMAYNPGAIRNIAAHGSLYVAVDGAGNPVGCGAVSPHTADADAVWVHAVFTAVDALGTGVGRAVMAALEADPLARQAGRIELAASLTAEGFYTKLGYTYKGGTRTVTGDGVLPMQKRRDA